MIMLRLRTTSAHAAQRPTPKLFVRLRHQQDSPPPRKVANQRALHAPSGLCQGGNDALPLELKLSTRTTVHQAFRLVHSVWLTALRVAPDIQQAHWKRVIHHLS